MNYASLVSAIESTVENTFETTDVNRFIQLTEQLVYNTVQLPALRKNVTGSLTSGNKYLGIPSDWLSTFSLAVIDGSGNYAYLLDKDVNYIREAFPAPGSTGQPTHYAVFDSSSFIVGPTPDSAYSVELHYFYYPESIVTAGTTWLGDNFDSVLLNGALLEAARFLKLEADTIQLYTSMLDSSMQALKVLGDGKDRQDAYRSGQARVKVT